MNDKPLHEFQISLSDIQSYHGLDIALHSITRQITVAINQANPDHPLTISYHNIASQENNPKQDIGTFLVWRGDLTK